MSRPITFKYNEFKIDYEVHSMNFDTFRIQIEFI